MKATQKLYKTSGKQPDLIKLRLQTVRLKKMLENVRSIIDLFEDGKEKLSGEYIFDQHYNVSMVDKIIERSRRAVFDASVLMPEGNQKFYAAFDKCRRFADEFLSAPSAIKDENNVNQQYHDPDAFENTAEYKTLTKVLDWIEGSAEKDVNSAMTIITSLFDNFFSSLEKGKSPASGTYKLEIQHPAFTNHIELTDLGGGIREKQNGSYAIDDLECKPLQLILKGIFGEEKISSSSDETARNWSAIITDSHLSLRSLDSAHSIFLETTLMNNINSDFTFLYSKSTSLAENHLPQNFHIKKTPLGYMIWSYGRDWYDLEKDIILLGNTLFTLKL